MVKKNFVRVSHTNKVNREVGFTYPKIHEGKKIFVDFLSLTHPLVRRKRIKKHFDSIKKKRERMAAMQHYISVKW